MTVCKTPRHAAASPRTSALMALDRSLDALMPSWGAGCQHRTGTREPHSAGVRVGAGSVGAEVCAEDG